MSNLFSPVGLLPLYKKTSKPILDPLSVLSNNSLTYLHPACPLRIMTDEPAKGNRTETTTPIDFSSSPYFTYPSLPLDLSLDSLLAHSSTPSSSSVPIMTKSETDTSSLAESWASLTGTEFSHEDDIHSEHTDVGSLLDVHSSDDVHSVIDAEHQDPDESSDEDGQGADAATSQQSLPFSQWDRPGLHIENSASNLRASFTEAEQSDSHATLPEYYHAENPFNEHENRALRRHLQGTVDAEQCFGATRMGLLAQGVNLNTLDYFKVVLLGRSIEQFRPEIQRKLGDVLVSQGGSSQCSSRGSVTRFHLVPNTFGPGAEPDFADLVAIDKQIDFDCYDQVDEIGSSHSRTNLRLRNRSTSSEFVSIWNGRNFVVNHSRWISPDLAIICVELDSIGELDRCSHNMIRFTERHQIPRIVIRMDRGWAGNYGGIQEEGDLLQTIDTGSEQLPPDLQGAPKFPVDIAGFLNLDSALLNKHIAFIISRADEASSRAPPGITLYPNEPTEKKSNQPLGRITFFLPARYSPLIIIFTTTIILTSMVGLLFSILLSLPAGSTSGLSTTTTQIAHSFPTVAISSTPTTLQTMQTSFPSASQQSLTALAQDDDAWQQQLASASVSRNEMTRDTDAHFQVGIASTSQLMVKLPKIATTIRKRSVLDVNLKRGEEILPVRMQELFDGVFSVTLEPRDSYGDIEVKLTMSNPPITETLTLSFGDQAVPSYDKLKTALNVVNGYAQEIIARLTRQVTEAREDIPAHKFVNDISTIGMTLKARLRKIRATVSAADLPHGNMQLGFRSWVVNHLKVAGAEVLQASRNRLVQGQRLLKEPLARFTVTRPTVLDLFQHVSAAEIKQQIHTTVVVDGLASAQGRAQYVVSRAASRLRRLKESLQTHD